MKELNQRVTVEQFEEIYDNQQERLAREEEVFGNMLDEEDLEAELREMMAQDALANEEAIPDAPTNYIAPKEAEQD